jgi:hypothetical protein
MDHGSKPAPLQLKSMKCARCRFNPKFGHIFSTRQPLAGKSAIRARIFTADTA